MASNPEYALMAGRAYFDTRADINRFPVPQGWTEFFHVPNRTYQVGGGFEAVSFQRGNEIVISFAGTATGVDWLANAGLATGFGSDQLRDAAAYYLEIRKTNPGATISFTGHSLGGGLASLMGVFFNRMAVTFDQAPFYQSANVGMRDVLIEYLKTTLNYTDAQLTQWVPELGGFTDLASRQTNVVSTNVAGEALSLKAVELFGLGLVDRIGNQVPLLHGGTDVSAIDLHSQTLLAAFLQNVDFQLVTYKLPDMLRMIFDGSLYKKDTGTGNTEFENFIERLVRHQAGNIGGVPIGGDKMLDRFTTDLQKVAQDGGLTLTNNDIAKALIAFSMQMYYEKTTTDSKQLFDVANITGGLHFDRNDVVDTTNAAKGDKYFQTYLTAAFSPQEQVLINSLLPVLRDWYIQAGTSALTATDTLNRNAFLLGGTGSDTLTGGTGTDLLIGNAGTDTLTGGRGTDLLLGGAGNDTYVYTTGDGLDILLDTADQNSLQIDGEVLTGGAEFGDNRVHRSADGKHLYVENNGQMLIDGNLVIQNYAAGGSFNLTMTGAATVSTPQTTHDINGDPLIHSATIASGSEPATWKVIGTSNPRDVDDGQGGQIHVQDVDYYLIDTTDRNPTEGGGPARADSLVGTGANDHIMSGADDDIINATQGGSDFIEAGTGRDKVYAGAGNDVLTGGADGDILSGGTGDDRLYADAQITTAAAIAQGNAQNGSGQQGDWLAGGSGADTLLGSSGNDVLTGGGGADLLIAGAGDDDIQGDADWVATSLNWTVTDQPTIRHFDPVTGTQFPSDGAADMIYAGGGSDHAWGGIGNDIIFGEGGDDQLYGEEGNDIVLGGAGKDVIRGDGGNSPDNTEGNDYLDGGDGQDTIFGNGGDDVIIGGKEDDTLYGGAGRDIYIFNKGDGHDTVYDTKADNDIFRFGEGISQNDITLHLGSLLLDLGPSTGSGQGRDEIHIGGFNPNDVFNSASIGSFEFADGTTLSSDQLLARGFDLDGTAGNDTIFGTNTTDRMRGLAGNDLLIGGDGDDVLDGGSGDDLLQGGAGGDILDGGSGNDLLQGGTGNDSYLFNRGSGLDSLDDEQGSNTLRLGAGVAPADIRLTRSGLDMVLAINPSPGSGQAADQLTLKNWGLKQSARIETLEFDDGTVWTAADLQAQFPATIIGTTGDDVQTAWFDQDTTLQGLAGNDTLLGNDGNDWLDGGVGNDRLNGGGGADTYVLKQGAGQDIITGADYRDEIVFGAGIDADSVEVSRTAAGVRIAYGGVGDSVLIEGDTTPDQLRFADGTRIVLATLFPTELDGYTVTGTAAGESLVDTHSWAKTFAGGAGNDVILGGGNATTYRFNQGDGQDTLADLGGMDTFAFGAGITVDDIRLAWEDWGDDAPRMKVYYGAGDSDVIAVLHGEQGTIEQFSFDDGSRYSFAQMADRLNFSVPIEVPVAEGRLFQSWNTGNTGMIVGTEGSDRIEANNDGNVIYAAGKGNDQIRIRENDAIGIASLLFNVGDGNDIISVVNNSNFNSQQHNTSLIFGSGITPESLTFAETTWAHEIYDSYFLGGWAMYIATDLVIGYGTQDDSILVDGGLDSSATFEFADGRHFDYEELRYYGTGSAVPGGPVSGAYQFTSGSGSQVITGFSQASDDTPVSSVAFGAGITPAMLSLGLGSLLIRVGDEGDELHIADFDPNDVYAPNQIQDFRFGDGTMLTYRDLIGLGFDLEGTAQDDVITGTNATDRIDAHEGNDSLSGGAGNDVLSGGTGNDTYLFGYGDGVDRIYDHDTGANTDVVSFAASVNPADVEVLRAGDDLELHLAGSADSLILSNWNVDDTHKVEQVGFANGTVWDVAYLQSRAPLLPIVGTEGDDTLYSLGGVDTDLRGLGGNDTLIGSGVGDRLEGGAGDDLLAGAGGDDVYLFNPGDGQDVIGEVAGVDTIRFGAGIVASDITFALSGSDLVLSTNGTGDQLTIQGWGDGPDFQIERMEFADGTAWDAADLQAQVLAITIMGTEGDDYLQGWSGESATLLGLGGNDTLSGGSAGDTLDGGAGSDLLAGGGGDDVYLFSPGGGQDVIGEVAGVDTLRFGAGIAASDISFYRSGSDLVLGIDGMGDQLTIPGWKEGSDYRIERVEFADGTSWDSVALQARVAAIPICGTQGDDSLGGNAEGNVLVGGAGNDNLWGYAGNDTLEGGIGNDFLYAGEGNDIYVFNVGDGQDIVQDGDSAIGNLDTIRFGAGISAGDIVLSRSGGDLVLDVARGNGRLTIQNWKFGEYYRIERVEFADGTDWDLAAQASGILMAGTDGADVLQGDAGNNVLAGGRGNDTLFGREGNDVYLFEQGDGQDTIYDGDSTPGNLDTIRIGAGFVASDISFARNGNDLVLGIEGGSDQLTVRYWGYGDYYHVERLEFVDGTVMDLEAQVSTVPILGTSGDDYLYGDDGNNTLEGRTGNDAMYGGEGSDVYIFNPGDGQDKIYDIDSAAGNRDTIRFGAGIAASDISLVRSNNDLVFDIGGAGDSLTIWNWGDGVDTRIELVEFVDGTVWDSADLQERTAELRGLPIIGSDAADDLYAWADEEVAMLGMGGNDYLSGSAGRDSIDGGAGNDEAYGGDGDDMLIGGGGVDILDGGAGNDVIHAGDHAGAVFDGPTVIAVEEDGTIPSATLVGGSGEYLLQGTISAANSSGGDDYDFYRFANLSAGTVLSAANFSQFESRMGLYDAFGNLLVENDYADGEGGSLNYDDPAFQYDILADGDYYLAIASYDSELPADPFTASTSSSDVSEMGGYLATVSFSGGYVTPALSSAIIGGPGDDVIYGGIGNDTYRFWSGDGQDTITDHDATPGNLDVLSLEDALPEDVVLVAGGNDLIVNVGGAGDSITVKNWRLAGDTSYRVEQIAFADGTTWDEAALLDQVGSNVNHAPLATPVADQLATQGETFAFAVPADSFVDSDAGDALTLDASLADGSPLPSWLAFDAATQTFTGTPANDDVGNLSLKLTATDSFGVSASSGFSLTVANTNDAPIVGAGITAGQATEDAAFGFVVPNDAFGDVDVGDVLTLSASLTDGNPLPAWLTFDAATRTFSGMPLNQDVGSLSVAVVATDAAGTSASQSFDLTVANTNDAPTVGAGITAAQATEDSVFAFTVPDDALVDLDVGDTLSYQATLANGDPLPAWLAFDAATRTFSGTPVNEDVGTAAVSLTATDTTGASASQTFALDVANTNDAPTVGAGITEAQATEDSAFRFVVPAEAFSDVDASDTLSLSATLVNGDALPKWLSFDAATRTFSGSPLNEDVGLQSVSVTATDAADASASQVFALDVANTNDTPIVGAGITAAQAMEDSAFGFVVPNDAFGDVDAGDALTLSASLADGAPLPAWLSFDTATRTFSGTPLNEDVGSLSVSVIATDAAGASASQVFALDVANTNDTPIVGAGMTAGPATEDAAFGFVVPADAFSDVDVGDVLTLSASLADGNSLPAWFSFDAATGTFSGTPANEDVGLLSVSVAATDAAGATASQTFALDVANTNDAPEVDSRIAPLVATEDSSFAFTVPVTAFKDIDVGDTLTLTASLTNGDPLPPWLVFDAATRTFAGTAANENVGALAVTLTATDAAGASASQSFSLTVANTNDAPIVSAGIATALATEDSVFAFIVPDGAFSDVDVGDSLAYTATLANGDPLPAWLIFDAATRTFSGTPLNQDVGALSVSVTATDAEGAPASQVFALDVANTNDAPIVGAGITATSATEDAAFAFVVPDGAYSDPDAGDSLGYAATTAEGNPLPAWLVFDAATRTFSGTSANADVGTVSVTLTATDIAGAAAGQSFDLTVTNTNDAPLLAAPLSDVQTNAGTLFSWSLPVGTFADPDVGDVLGYRAGLADGSPLPDWLGFDAATGTLSGTPGPANAGALNVTFTATDGSGATAAGAMTLTVVSLTAEGQLFIGTPHADTLTGTGYDDVFDGRAGADTLIGLGGDDLFLVTDQKDRIVEQANGGFDSVWADTGFTLPDQVEALAFVGAGDYAGTGNGLGNLLVGNRGDNRLDGKAGDDILLGRTGDDSLLGGTGMDALDGGSGDDVLEDGDGAGFIAGGRGDDTLRLGTGADVIAFNRGDGADRIQGGDGQNDSLSLGGGIRVADIRLQKSGKDLIVDTGKGDSLQFVDWYRSSASRTIATLQVATDTSGTAFERYNFTALVQKFDSVLAANKRIDAWTPGSEASRFRLDAATSDVAGGSLAATYASSGALDGIRPEALSATLATPRSDATATDGLADTPLPPQPAYHGGKHEDHDSHGDDHGHDGHGHDGRDDRDGHFGDHGKPGPYLSPREVEAAWQSWRHQGASTPSASPVDYALGWARVRDRLAGRLDEGDHGGAWCERPGGARQDGFSLLSGGHGAFGAGNSIGLPGAGLKPFEGLKEGFERLHGS
ncbi:MAG: putative Ig domain-containing protein [bacterium]|nr:putative Ig domain-containing protein [bacterium]